MAEGLWDEGRRAWTRLLAWLTDGRASAVDVLADITLLRQLLARAEARAVGAARREGRSWSEIAAAVGMSRQSAWERWRDLDAPLPDAPAVGGHAPETAPETTPETTPGAAPATAAGDLVEALLDGPPEVRVPDVVGVPWPPARRTVRAADLVAVVVDPVDLPLDHPDDWHVVEQKPVAGGLVPRGSSVSLWLRRGPGSAGVREPRRPLPDPRSARGAHDDTVDDTADAAAQ
jgi:hypothetical protein